MTPADHIARIREALDKWLSHKHNCAQVNRYPRGQCTCGLDEALASLEASLKAECTAPLQNSDIPATENGESMGCEESERTTMQAEQLSSVGDVVAQIKAIADTGVLPDGDSVPVAVQLWAEKTIAAIQDYGEEDKMTASPEGRPDLDLRTKGGYYGDAPTTSTTFHGTHGDSMTVVVCKHRKAYRTDQGFRYCPKCNQVLDHSPCRPAPVSLEKCADAAERADEERGDFEWKEHIAKAVLEAAGIAYE